MVDETRFVNASSSNVTLLVPDSDVKYKVPTSLFTDQFISRMNGEKQLMTLPVNEISKDGIIDFSRF